MATRNFLSTYMTHIIFPLNSTALRIALSFKFGLQPFVMQSLEIREIRLERWEEREE